MECWKIKNKPYKALLLTSRNIIFYFVLYLGYKNGLNCVLFSDFLLMNEITGCPVTHNQYYDTFHDNRAAPGGKN